MYEEIVKRLWECASGECFNCSQYTENTNASVCSKELMKQAANAIEERDMKLHGANAAIAGMQREIERMVVSEQPRWIPVTERLPEEYETVLLLPMSGEVISGYYDSEHKSYCDMTGFRHLCTHWMPLPEPPKESEKDG